MSLEGLRKFNAGYGFPLDEKRGERGIAVAGKIVSAIPFAAIIMSGCKLDKTRPGLTSRMILASTIVGLPIIFLLDIIATLFTQPIGRALEKHRAKQLQQ